MKRFSFLAGAALLLAGCSALPSTVPTLGELSSNSTYVPLDGLPIETVTTAGSCQGYTQENVEFKPLLDGLPDISIRFAISQVANNAKTGFGPVAITTEGSNYKAILDYVNNDTVPVSFYIRKIIKDKRTNETHVARLSDALSKHQAVAAYEAIIYAMNNKPIGNKLVGENKTALTATEVVDQLYESVTIPVYIGLGLRVTADVYAQKGGVEISSLGSVGADGLAGGLTMQSIGVTGPVVGTILPIPRTINQTTIENTIMALGSSRTLIFTNANDENKITLTPRVVGLYSPIGSDPQLINALYSELARVRTQWNRPCIRKNTNTT
ncbi:hypothetical protein RYZ26_08535 [Terasakiella sp. A23]|uniref:hypothetical protein n=1 Tax=Terasakiella sp. FCG-A23 TaxID=3080561 RepID=UPI00295338E2|nr:hypothetical protein [Terasakiella sp. A23]MDV7339636.1 hypothetical protein [Terasakiella sp. A23]